MYKIMTTPNSDNTVRCPYVPEHVMHVESLLTHLNRCKATNKHLFRSCLYNSLHIILRQHYQQHIQNCQDGMTFKREPVQEAWQQKQKNIISQSLNSSLRSPSNDSSSNHSFAYSYDDSSDYDNRYGYYNYADYNYSLDDRDYGQQYDPIEAQYHSTLFYKDRHLNYLNPASMTIPKKCPKEKKKVDVSMDYAKLDELFRRKTFARAISQKDTVDSQSQMKGKERSNYEEGDSDLWMCLEEMDISNKKFMNYHDQYGDELMKHAMILKQNRNNNYKTNSSIMSRNWH